MNISIITPVLNEAAGLTRFLADSRGTDAYERIMVDGGSSDATLEIVKEHNLCCIQTFPGRGGQQNAGARAATGNVLLFLHCDTSLPENFAAHIRDTLHNPDVVAGAFHLAIDAPGLGYRIIERGANLRSRLLGLPYGDQALFVRKDVFLKTGGFPDQPILEELPLLHHLKKHGRIKLAKTSVQTSARRWQKHGLINTTLLNQCILAAFLLGVDSRRLAHWYSRA